MSVLEKARPGGGGQRPKRRSRRLRVLLLLLLAGLGAAAVYWWGSERGPAPEAVPPPAVAPGEPSPLGSGAPAAPAATAPEPEALPTTPPEPAELLPALGQSDGLARQLAAGVSTNPLFAAALRQAGVIDRLVAVVDQLAEGNSPRRDLTFLRPHSDFRVLGSEPELRIDPASYRRYDALAAATASLDASAAVAAYRRLAPLCEQSYRALGYPQGGFEQRLRAALALVGSTPQIEDSPALVAHVKRYEFADPGLESLSDAQKQVLRMGPKNAALVAGKARAIEAALGPPAP